MNNCKICNAETPNEYFCSRKCSGLSKSKDNNIKHTGKKIKRERISVKCGWDECEEIIEAIKSETKMRFCSNTCHIKWANKYQNLAQKGGRATRDLLVKRSKNEIHFAELCKEHFTNVRTNEGIFNGWDADVIIDDIKVAVMWNGAWHYKKITKQHSLGMTQNRDKLKIKNIKEYGYIPYIIKDMGKQNPKFVEEQFQIFLKEHNCQV